jgi:4-amino-4-deoxy-L-arabinose transferase-like glycosyltransferase
MLMCGRGLRNSGFAVLGIALLTIVTRLPALLEPHPIDDETVYSVVANEIVDGGRLYADAVERKPPLLFWTYAAIFAAAGKYNWFALHLVGVAWVLLTMAGLYIIDSRLFDAKTGLVAGLLYGIFQPWAIHKNLAFNGELLMNLPIVWAWAIALRPHRSIVRPDLLASGALLGMAFLLKQPAAIAAVPLAVYLLLPSYRHKRGLTPLRSVAQAALLATGFLGTLGIVAVVLWKQGVLREALYWTIGDHAIRHVFWSNGAVNTAAFVACSLPLIVGAAMSIRTKYGIWVGRQAELTALIALAIASVVGVIAGARFYPHYYIQLIVPLALLAAPFYSRLWSRAIASNYSFAPALGYICLGLTVIAFFISNFSGADLESRPRDTATYLLQHSSPTDRIFVWGQRPLIYLEAERRPACRYIATFPLTGYTFGGPLSGFDTRRWIRSWAWTDLQNDFARHPPIYIIDTEASSKALYPIKNFPILSKLVSENYQPVSSTTDGVIYRRRSSQLQ